jgi:hypothetical protein
MVMMMYLFLIMLPDEIVGIHEKNEEIIKKNGSHSGIEATA